MELLSLKAGKREAGSKNDARQHRREGNVPGVLYGGGQNPVTLTINSREFVKLVQTGGSHAIVQIDVTDNTGDSGPALLKDVQYHPVRGHVIHADFQRIRLDERIVTLVPLNFVGHCKGLVDGGVLDYQIRELEIECLALEVPEKIDVDITDLGIGEHLYASVITVPEGISIVTDPARSVVACQAPRAAKDDAPGADAAADAAAAPAADAKAADPKAKAADPKAKAADPKAKSDKK